MCVCVCVCVCHGNHYDMKFQSIRSLSSSSIMLMLYVQMFGNFSALHYPLNFITYAKIVNAESIMLKPKIPVKCKHLF